MLNFLLKEDNLSGDLYQVILNDREKWRLKMIQDVCNYVGIEENDPVIKGLHEMDRANFIREDMFPIFFFSLVCYVESSNEDSKENYLN